MSNTWLSYVFEHSAARAGARLVLLALADRADESGCCWPSVEDIGRRAGNLSDRQVRACIHRLVTMGELTIPNPGGGWLPSGRGKTNTFQLVQRDPAEPASGPAHPEAGNRVRPATARRESTPHPEVSGTPTRKFSTPHPEVSGMTPGSWQQGNPHRTLNEPLTEPSTNPQARAELPSNDIKCAVAAQDSPISPGSEAPRIPPPPVPPPPERVRGDIAKTIMSMVDSDKDAARAKCRELLGVDSPRKLADADLYGAWYKVLDAERVGT